MDSVGTRPLAVLDCNIFISATLLTGPPFSLHALMQRYTYKIRNNNEVSQSALALLAAFATVSTIRYCISNHILHTTCYKLMTDGEWEEGEANEFITIITENLIYQSQGFLIQPVVEGWVRMGDHEDALVYNTCQQAANIANCSTILVTADKDFRQRISDTINRGAPYDRVVTVSPTVFIQNITKFARQF